MLIKDFQLGQLETNCYIVTDEDTLECAVIDPGDESNTVLDYLEEHKLRCRFIFLTHGHYYSVSMGTERLKEEARARGAQIALYGHTHRPVVDMGRGDVIAVNPGSLSYPRQEGRRPSYVLMELDRLGEVHFSIAYL